MRKEKAKIKYDFEEDVFLARPIKRDYNSSFQIGDFILDLDKNNKISGLELLNASKVFGISKAFLKNMVSGRIELIVTEEFIQINIQIKTQVRNTESAGNISIQRVKPEFINPAELQMAIA